MRQTFGACGNFYAPDDGRVVSADHGCGAHSEALVEAAETPVEELPTVYDDSEVEAIAVSRATGLGRGRASRRSRTATPDARGTAPVRRPAVQRQRPARRRRRLASCRIITARPGKPHRKPARQVHSQFW